MRDENGFGSRFYRHDMGLGRFSSVQLSVAESDLWIGVDAASAEQIGKSVLIQAARRALIRSRTAVTEYGRRQKRFFTALVPLPIDPGAETLPARMLNAGRIAGVGPMSAVAGAVSEAVGETLLREFSLHELVVENGGDLFVQTVEELRLRIFAGRSPLSGKIGIRIPAARTPLGVCTSAGTVGPSFSRGKADAVTICCRDTALADAYATAFANEVQSKGDVQQVINRMRERQDILSGIVIKDEKAAVCGTFEVFTD
ncbi:MAG: UPF0280 family protein [Spirochaetota bacterium]